MFKWVDRSRLLSGILDWFSNLLAKQRGLPIVIGIILVLISFVLQSVNVFADSNILHLIGLFVHHVGVLIALIGILLATPLGR